MADKDEAPNSGLAEAEPALPELRFLKALVTALAGTMILGLLAILALLVIRFSAPEAPLPALPERIALPEGTVAEAVTFGRDWIAVVTEAGEILLYDAASGALRQRVTPAP